MRSCVVVVRQSVLTHYTGQEEMLEDSAALRDWIAAQPGAEERFLRVWQAHAGYPQA